MAEILPEKWMKGVAITATVLAVMTAIAASRGAACGAKTQLLTAIEGSKWAYYQAKSIKQNLAETQKNAFEVDALGALTVEQKALLDQKLNTVTSEIERYGQEKEQIKQEAEAVGLENAAVGKKASRFSAAVVLFQIAIMLTSVSALIKRKEMWLIGIIFGLIAAVLLTQGLIIKPLLF
ncbi:MAG TPA: DUF4337 family protein [Candidatus Omnitrophota bacterium]|nr:DUF4337 family protein [Candidatus Omnitrophota bacterium]